MIRECPSSFHYAVELDHSALRLPTRSPTEVIQLLILNPQLPSQDDTGMPYHYPYDGDCGQGCTFVVKNHWYSILRQDRGLSLQLTGNAQEISRILR